MIHRNGRPVYGVSFADIQSGERSRCNVSPVQDEPGKPVRLVACGSQYGSPLDRESLSDADRVKYDEWCANEE